MPGQTVRGLALLLLTGFLFCGGCGESKIDTPAPQQAKTSAGNGQQLVAQPPAVDIATWQEELENRLRSNEAADRYKALVLLGDDRIDAETRVASMVDAISREEADPTVGDLPVEGVSLPASEFMLLRLSRKMGDTASKETLKDVANEQSGAVKERVVLSRGFGGDRDAVPELEQLLQASESGWTRAHAAFLLGELKSHSSEQLLQAALKDTFRIQRSDHGTTIREYPVRVKALTALRKLGTDPGEQPLLFEPQG